MPSFKLKIDYARWDYLQYRQGIGAFYPDAERLISMEIGLDIGKRSPLFGIGAGDLEQAVKAAYNAPPYAGKYNYRMPHNQFVTLFAGVGIIGLVLFLTGFFYPLLYRKNYRQPLFLALHAIVFMSFFMENTIENNFGVSMYLFFLLIGLNYLSNQNSPEDRPGLAEEEVVRVPFLRPKKR
jgi:O-antigen ligase